MALSCKFRKFSSKKKLDLSQFQKIHLKLTLQYVSSTFRFLSLLRSLSLKILSTFLGGQTARYVSETTEGFQNICTLRAQPMSCISFCDVRFERIWKSSQWTRVVFADLRSRMEKLKVHCGTPAICRWYRQSRKQVGGSTVKRASINPRLKENGLKHSRTTTVLRIWTLNGPQRPASFYLSSMMSVQLNRYSVCSMERSIVCWSVDKAVCAVINCLAVMSLYSLYNCKDRLHW